MMKHDSLYNILAQRFATAVAEVAGLAAGQIDPALRPATDPKFGDYQCNVAMSLARSLKSKPRDIAQRIKDAIEPGLAGIAEPLEIAGPGFINIRLKDSFLAGYLAEIPAPPGEEGSGSGVQGSGKGAPPAIRSHVPTFPRSHAVMDRVGLAPAERPMRVVVEYSQPNIAKQMHVGHLRSTIIGDVFARVLDFEGHEVVRQNHIGDWGTQFGMLIRWYRDNPLPTAETHADVLEAIENDYKAANERFKSDERWAAEARQAVGQLQGGDPDAYRLWEQICRVSLDAIDGLYRRLGVLLRPEDVRGESFYNDRLQPLVDELRRLLPARDQGSGIRDRGSGIRLGDRPPVGQSRSHVPTSPHSNAEVRDDRGAVCVFLHDDAGQPLFKNPDGEILPLIIQKSDGAFLYATTDLAAIRFRLRDLKARRVIYVTDARQKLHFDMWMAAARAADWIAPDVSVEHVTFGTVLGSDRRPLKTRDGGTIKLRELLDEAEARALELLRKRAAESDEGPDGAGNDGPSDDEMRGIASAVGVASIKYADLRNDRNSDYVFAWDKMISFQGNTAPYMMYAYARIRSIYRKAAERFGSPDVYATQVGIRMAEPAERMLALKLSRLREAIDVVAADLTPHTLCAYLYDLASEFMRFYESCPVLAAPDEPTRLSRMRLCDLTARTLKLGLGLLGIEVIERM